MELQDIMRFRSMISRLIGGRQARAANLTEEEHKSLMQDTWNRYAKRNAAFYIATEGKALDEEFQWNMEDFFNQGRRELTAVFAEFEIPLAWLDDKSVLEIGCGIGRQTRALADLANSVIAFDISEEMLKRARDNLSGYGNVELFKSEGSNLEPVKSNSVDLVYSFVVFQHITDKSLTKSYFSDVSRVLKSGGRFLFQVRDFGMASSSGDVWEGSDVSENDIRSWSKEFGFHVDRMVGHGTHYLWAGLTRL